MTPPSKDNTTTPVSDKDRGIRLTATQVIGGVECRITLERDDSGRYREIMLTPLARVSMTRD